jgi:predicted nucleic acid-binding protein
MPTELLHGAAASAWHVENRRKVERFAGRMQVLAWGEEAASRAADTARTC